LKVGENDIIKYQFFYALHIA